VFSSRRRHTISYGDWSSDVCSSDLVYRRGVPRFCQLHLAESRYTSSVHSPNACGGTVFAGLPPWKILRITKTIAVPKNTRKIIRSEERRVGKEDKYRGA